MDLGYALSSEEHAPRDLVRWARRAEACGFSFAMISDHYHPWVERQGQASFVWTVLGAIGQATGRLTLITGVTCPTMRIHPAILAQAAATTAALLPGRFLFGIGSGENLNEHILGQRWPSAEIRLAMLEEAVQVIRLLWSGGLQSHYGTYYTVEDARLFTLPEEPPLVLIAASGSQAAALAGQLGDGLITTAPDRALVERFSSAGAPERPRYTRITGCVADDAAAARHTAHAWWPNAALPGILFTELALPGHVEQACKIITEAEVAREVLCGPDVRPWVERIETCARAGFDHVCLHQVGPDQDAFFDFFERALRPALAEARLTSAVAA